MAEGRPVQRDEHLTAELTTVEPERPAEPVPGWFETLATWLPLNSQFAISGNVRDLYRLGTPEHPDFLSFDDTVLRLMHGFGIETFVTFDPVDGVGIHGACGPEVMSHLDAIGIRTGREEDSFAQLEALTRAVSGSTELPLALIVRYASHLASISGTALDRLLVAVDKIAASPAPRASADLEASTPAHNPVFWLLDRPGDLPDWFIVGNRTVRHVRIDLPDLEDRFTYALTLGDRFADDPTLTATDRQMGLLKFALRTEGMTLCEMASIAALAARQKFGIEQSAEAIRSFRTGIRRNPWTSSVLLERLKNGRSLLAKRVKGQDHAIEKTLDILIRSAMGLSGSQASSRLNRPRGVMFFAGPTGVGKTEMAKAVTELLFGDDSLCHRFDMTEFNTERSVARLVGAPPGYAGHESGGELTNAVRRRPFSVILFDEIEKAHPRVLDMFLQILDEGRLTDSRGETSYFSEAVIIFTSNVGILGGDVSTNMGMEILPSDPYGSLRAKLLEGIRKHFMRELRRPELLNRIGQNVVAFDFIHVRSAEMIFAAILQRVLETVLIEKGVQVTFEAQALKTLSSLCIDDMMEGGRGIGNRIEAHFINPLAHVLLDLAPRRRLKVEAIETLDGDTRLLCCADPRS